MKKSQIFLGANAIVLVIFGVMATKATRKSITHVCGWTTASGAICHRLSSALLTTIKHGPAKTARTAANVKTLYTVSGPVGRTICGKKCYTNAQN